MHYWGYGSDHSDARRFLDLKIQCAVRHSMFTPIPHFPAFQYIDATWEMFVHRSESHRPSENSYLMIYAERRLKPQGNKWLTPLRSHFLAPFGHGTPKPEERHKHHYHRSLMRVIRGARNSTSTSPVNSQSGSIWTNAGRELKHLNDDVENINFDICKLLFSVPSMSLWFRVIFFLPKTNAMSSRFDSEESSFWIRGWLVGVCVIASLYE